MRNYFEIQDFTSEEALYKKPLKVYKDEFSINELEELLNNRLKECLANNPKPDYVVTAYIDDGGISFIRGNYKKSCYVIRK